MSQKKVTDEEILKLKSILLTVVAKQKDKDYGKDDKTSSISRTFATSGSVGRRVYESFTDEQLTAYLWSCARELDHPPAQKEVFWVMRDYIKQRFGKWPYALKAAGLSSAAGRGGRAYIDIQEEKKEKEELLQAVRDRAAETGKLPHPGELPQVRDGLKKYYDNWGEILRAAGIDGIWLNQQCVHKIEDLEPPYLLMLDQIREKARELGRVPVHQEIDSNIRRALSKRCGSWRNALYQIGLSPVIKMRPFQGSYVDHRKDETRRVHTNSLGNCFYQVLNLTEEDKALLGELEGIYKKTKKVPLRKALTREQRQQLIKRCGSWGNAMYQIGIMPDEYRAAVEEAKREKAQKASRSAKGK